MPYWKWLLLTVAILMPTGNTAKPLENFRGVVRDPAGGWFVETSIAVQRWEWDESSKRFHAVNPPPIHLDSNGKFSAYLTPGLYDVFVSSYWGEPIALKVEIAPLTPTELECDFRLSPLVPTISQQVIDLGKPGPLVAPHEPRPSACIARKVVVP